VILHGHSGAPILNDVNQVVAVASGGLEGGKDHRTWATPWSRIHWISLTDMDARKLGRAPETLFAYTPEEIPLPYTATQALSAGSEGTVSMGHVGFIPGLHGQLNPILDTSKRTYLYANNVAISGERPQPVNFQLNVPFEVEDSRGNRFSLTISSIDEHGAIINYRKLSNQNTDGSPRLDVNVTDLAGAAIANAIVQVVFSDGTYVSASTDTQGHAMIADLKRSIGDVTVTHPNFLAQTAITQSLRSPLSVRLRASTTGGSVTFNGSTGQLPGLIGRLNPIRDTENRTYIYADNIALNGGEIQPLPFSIDTPFEAEDSRGNRFRLFVIAVKSSSSTIAFEKLLPRSVSVPKLEVTVMDPSGHAVSSAMVVIVFPDGTFLNSTTSAEGVARFTALKNNVADIFVAHSDYAAAHFSNSDLREPLSLRLNQTGSAKSIIFFGGTGSIPGLDGRLRTIFDRRRRRYVYGDRLQINGGPEPPVYFQLGQPLTVRDSNGTAFRVTIVAMSAHASLLEYQALSR
jgi:hypothetical protein